MCLENGEWLETGELEPGARLRGANGVAGTLLRTVPVAQHVKTWNLSLEEIHGYFRG